MDRRRFLAAFAAGTALASAGCRGRGGRSRSGTPADEAGTATTPRGPVRHGYPPRLCAAEPMADPGIYAVTEPAAAADWAGYRVPDRYRGATVGGYDSEDTALAPEHTVVGLGRGEGARAYPLDVLQVHEIVNDSVALDAPARQATDADVSSTAGTAREEVPVTVTFCPLCRSGLVARRVVDGAATTFEVTGLLWEAPRIRSAVAERAGDVFGAAREGGATPDVRNSGNLVMVDRATGSYWSQILAEAICGPEQGTHLEIVPSTVTTWGAWRRDNPETDVLLPPPHSGTVAPGE